MPLVRMSFVAYGDHHDGARRLDHIPFTSNIDAVRRKVGDQVATGGDDLAEDVLGGLNLASFLDWKGDSRFMILVADVPCHGRNCHTGTDAYPNGDPYGLKCCLP